MIILFYKSEVSSEITNQRIDKPSVCFSNLDPNNKVEAKKIFRSLIAQFGNPQIEVDGYEDIENDNFRVYELSAKSIKNFIGDFNENDGQEVISPDYSYSMMLNLDIEDVKELICWTTKDYIIVDRDTKEPRTYGKFGEILDVKEYFESADSEIKNLADETIYCLLSYGAEVESNKIVSAEVYTIVMEFNSVKEIDCFKVNNDKWNEEVRNHLFEVSTKKVDYVYLVKTEFENGKNYTKSNTESTYRTYERAKSVLNYLSDSVKADFERHYEKDDVTSRWELGRDIKFDISAPEDCWHGSVTCMEVKD